MFKGLKLRFAPSAHAERVRHRCPHDLRSQVVIEITKSREAHGVSRALRGGRQCASSNGCTCNCRESPKQSCEEQRAHDAASDRKEPDRRARKEGELPGMTELECEGHR